jgi:hypothetical protein
MQMGAPWSHSRDTSLKRRGRRSLLALLVVSVMSGTLALTMSPASAALDRSLVDRPDDLTGNQVHIMYVLASDSPDRSLDTNGVIEHSVESFDGWLRARTQNRGLRLDTYQGSLDVTFVRLSLTEAQLNSYGLFLVSHIESELINRGLVTANKVYGVYYDGVSTASCGGGAWPPELVGSVGAIYVRGQIPGYVPCDTQGFAGMGEQPRYLDVALLHELMHTLGFVARCAPHQAAAGVSDDPNDLMWSGTGNWMPGGTINATLDTGNDDYFGHHNVGCLDLTYSPYLTGSATPSGYLAVNPTRLVDTRIGLGVPAGRVRGGSVTRVQTAGSAAVALNLTVTNAAGSGYLTAFPCDGPIPTASNLNFTPGQTIANTTVSKTGLGGAVCIYSSALTDLIVDINGLFTGSAYTPVSPRRLLDTRSQGGAVADGSVTVVPTTADGGSSAVTVNVTVTNPTDNGYVTSYPCGTTPPNASNLNFTRGQTIANLAITKIGAGGAICIFSSVATDLIVDFNGSFASGSGYSPVDPTRVVDTRAGTGAVLAQLAAGTTISVPIASRLPGSSAATVNLTVTNTHGGGYLTAFPCGTSLPNASNLNFGEGQTIANLSITKVGADGAICIFTSATTDLVVDLNGGFGG